MIIIISTKRVSDYTRLGGESDTQGIVQESDIHPYKQM